MKGQRRDPDLIRRSQAGDQSGTDPESVAADAREREKLADDFAVSKAEAARFLSIMNWLFGGTEHTPLFVITFLTIICLALWVVLAIWGPDTLRITNLIDTLGKAFTFFIGLFSGITIGTRRR